LPPTLLDFQLGQIQLRLAARQQGNARAGPGETHGQPFADAAAGAGDEHAFILELAYGGHLSLREVSTGNAAATDMAIRGIAAGHAHSGGGRSTEWKRFETN